MNKALRTTFLLLGLIFNNFIFAQQVEIHSGYAEKRPELPDAIIYTKDSSGQVYIVHEGVEMWCDQAYLYPNDNFVRAYGDVYLTQGDTISLKSQFTSYNGNTQLAFAEGQVVLTEPRTTLHTDQIYFDRIKQQAYYNTGGEVRDSTNTLKSEIGRYYTESKVYQFVDKVEILNPDYLLTSDRLDFHSETGDAYLYGDTQITSDESKIYSERGFYQTRENIGYFVKNTRIEFQDRLMYGDSIYFDRNRNFASASNNIRVYDSINQSKAIGHYAEIHKDQDLLVLTKNPIVSYKQETDSLHINADKIIVQGPEKERIVNAYPDARFILFDYSGKEEAISGKADSLYINEAKGILKMHKKPVIWNGENQMTGDQVELIYNNHLQEIDSLKVYNNAFITDKDSISGGYNQIKGHYLIGLFTDNKIDTVTIDRNTEVLFYSRDEKDELIGIDKTLSSSIDLFFENNDIVGIRFNTEAKGKLYPESKLPKNARLLPGFHWRGEERIKKVSDLLLNKPDLVLPKIQGISLPEPPEAFFEEKEEREFEDSLESE